MDASKLPRKRAKPFAEYRFCPHCDKDINFKRFKEHESLFYNEGTKQWIKETPAVVPGIDGEFSSDFSSLDEGDGVELDIVSEDQWNSGSSDLDVSHNDEAQPLHRSVVQGPEYWTDSDGDIDRDVNTMPPQDLSLENIENRESSMVIKWVVLLLAVFQSRFGLTDRSIVWLLQFLYILLKVLGKYSNQVFVIAENFPQSLHKYNKFLGNISGFQFDPFQKRAACTQCNTLYTFQECCLINNCSYKPLRGAKRCGKSLIKHIVTGRRQPKVYPHMIFCFCNLASILQNLFLRPGFVEQCEFTRGMVSESLTDVYNGMIWNEFKVHSGQDFLSGPYNYGLLLNIDWFQPFEHITYSVGVIFLVVLNLPRSIRFKRENVILYGIIPGPSEPHLTMNSYLAPLVADLLTLWKGIQVSVAGSNDKITCRFALLGVSCDLPAGRKCCGFLSHSARLGCSKCYYEFFKGFGNGADYGGNFDRGTWRNRSNCQHREDVRKILSCTSITARSKAESQYGCRYSALLDLPYFDPVRMLLVDPMHNLFLGTAKHITLHILIGRNILKKEALDKIKSGLFSAVVPVGLGRLPTSIDSGVFLTAEQWKNWTLHFSIYCLHGLLSPEQTECWRHFVLACIRLCKYSVSENDLTIADALLLRFCRKVKEIYGIDALTPNMHMHCHLVSCIRDFGPLHSFWLFPFERYNGILGNQPTNNRSVEVQLMRRFLRDNVHLQLATEAMNLTDFDTFSDLFSNDVPQLDLNSERVLPCTKYIISSLSRDLVIVLRKLYASIYKDYSDSILNGQINVPSTYKRYSFIEKNGKRVYSSQKASAKSTYILAHCVFPFTTSCPSEFDGNVRPAQLHYFLEHPIILPNSDDPKTHLLARASWPMVHPNRFAIGKPVEIWCNGLNEPTDVNSLIPVDNIVSRVIFSIDKVSDETVLIVIPIVE